MTITNSSTSVPGCWRSRPSGDPGWPLTIARSGFPPAAGISTASTDKARSTPSASLWDRLRCRTAHRPSWPSPVCFVNCWSRAPTPNCRPRSHDGSERSYAIGYAAPLSNPSRCRQLKTPARRCLPAGGKRPTPAENLGLAGPRRQHQRADAGQAVPHRVRHDLSAVADQCPCVPRNDPSGRGSDRHRDGATMRVGHDQRVHRHLRPHDGPDTRRLPISCLPGPTSLSRTAGIAPQDPNQLRGTIKRARSSPSGG